LQLSCRVRNGKPSVYTETETAYQSGFNHGVDDAALHKANKSQQDYIQQPGNEAHDGLSIQ
jgi:hypothetical protein